MKAESDYLEALMRFLTLSAGDRIPHVGQGCMGIDEFSKDTTDQAHMRALEFGIDLGMTLLMQLRFMLMAFVKRSLEKR